MFELGKVLQAVGPSASIIFAAWIFMGFLQSRYDAAIERYRATVDDVREGRVDGDRRANVIEQAAGYRRRCELMGRALLIGLIAAIFLITALGIGAVDVIIPHVAALAWAGTACIFSGFALVILAAATVIREGRIGTRLLDAELIDVPELAEAIGKRQGNVR